MPSTNKLLGIPLDLGAERIGADLAPNALRYRKIIEKLQRVGISIEDLGNIESELREKLKRGNPRLKYANEIIRISEIVAGIVAAEIHKGNKIIAIGGDHSISLGTISGAAYNEEESLGLLWLDAHPDLNTEKTTMTGNVHGMPLAALLGEGNSELVNLSKKGAKIRKENVIIIGVKDIDLAEAELIASLKLKTFGISKIVSSGLDPIFDEINQLISRTSRIWVSIDLDVMDEQYAPGVGMPNYGGLTYREMSAISAFIGKNCKVVGMDIVEYNPVNDIEHLTSDLAIEIVAKILGKEYGSYTEYLLQNEL